MFLYLTIGGLGFLFFPKEFSRLLFSNTQYDDIPLRFAGMISFMFGFLFFEILRKKVKVLDGATIAGRIFVLLILVWFYTMSQNPMFIVFFCVGLIGLIITCLGFLQKR